MIDVVEKLIPRIGKVFSFTPLSLGDTHYYLKWFTSERVRKNLCPNVPRSEAEIRDCVKRMIDREDMRYFIIRVDGGHIGYAGMNNIDHKAKTAELSCVIGEEEMIGTGVGLRAMVHFFDFVFSDNDFDSVYVTRRKGATGEKFFSRLGFTVEHEDYRNKYTLSRDRFNKLRG